MMTRVLFVAGLLMSCQNTKKDPEPVIQNQTPIAIVGKDTIRLAEFRRLAQEREKSKLDLMDTKIREELLNDLITESLIVQEGYAQALDQADEVRFQMKTLRDEALAGVVVRKEIQYPLIPEAALKKQYESLKEEVRLRQILIGYYNTNMPKFRMASKGTKVIRFPKAAQVLADSLYDVLKKEPAKFETLVNGFTEDEDSKFRGGDIGWVRHGQLDRTIEEKIFSRPVSAILEPFDDGHGWRIFQILERRNDVALRPYEESLDALRDMLLADIPPGSVQRNKTRLTDSLMKTWNFRIQTDAVREFLRLYRPPPSSAGPSLPETSKQTPLAVFTDGQITMNELALALQSGTGKRSLTESLLVAGLRQAAEYKLLAKYAALKGYTLSRESESTLREHEGRLIRRMILAKNAPSQDSVDEMTLQHFLTANARNYKDPDSVSIAVLANATKEGMNPMEEEIRAKNNFDEVFERVRRKDPYLATQTGLIPVTLQNELMTRASGLRAGEVSEPFTRLNGQTAILKVTERKAGSLPPLNRVASRVLADYYQFREKTAFDQWRVVLKERYPITKVGSVLDKVYDIRLQ